MKFRFSFRTLIVVFTVAAIILGWFGWRLRRARRQQAAVVALEKAGASVRYTYQHIFWERPGPGARFATDPEWERGASGWTRWWGRRFGKDFVYNVKEVNYGAVLPAEVVKRIGDLRPFQSLTINVKSGFTDEAWQTLLVSANFKHLTLTRDQGPATRALSELSSQSQLRSLQIEGGDLTVDDARQIGQLTNLRELTLMFVSVTDESLAPLADLQDLEVLALTHRGHGNEVSDKGFAFLADLPKLRELTLARMPPLTDGLLPTLDALSQLELLNLDQASVEGTEIGRLSKLPRLQELNLIGTHFNDAGARQLVAFPALEVLDLGSTEISDSALQFVGSLPNLRVLKLSFTNVTNEGIEKLASLADLEQLQIAGTAVTDAGLEHLAQLSNLRQLWLGSQSNVTPKGIANLAKALPNCYVYQ